MVCQDRCDASPCQIRAQLLIRPDQLAHLTHHRWSVPALVEIHRMGGGARVAELLHRLEGHRLAIHQAVDQLIEIGLLMPNPGHGHPLRPEYLLSERGHRVAEASTRVVSELEKLDAAEIGLRKWTLPTTLAIAQGANRFGEMRVLLVSATDRAISQCLGLMTDASLVSVKKSKDDRRAAVYALRDGMAPVAEALGQMPTLAV